MKWEAPQLHFVKLDADLSSVNIAEMSDEELESFLNAANAEKNSICYTVSDHYILRNIGGESVLVPTDEAKLNGMITFSETGDFLWQQLLNPVTEEDLVQLLAREFVVDNATARSDVAQFLSNALRCGMIQKVSPAIQL